MKSKAKILLGSTLTIAMCASLITGSTLALFTSESKTNIAITSGKVSVTASAELVGAYSAKWDADANDYIRESKTVSENKATFTNKGTVAYQAESNTLEMNSVSPGDGAKIKVNINNESTVAIVYKISVVAGADDGLYEGLKTSISSDEDGAHALDSSWTPLAATADIEAVYVNVELPITGEDQNKYQEKSCSISVIVNAMQGNGHVTEFKPTDGSLRDALRNGTSPSIELQGNLNAAGKFYMKDEQTSQTLDLNGHTLKGNFHMFGFDGDAKSAYTHDTDIYIRNGTIISSSTKEGECFGIALFGARKEGTVDTGTVTLHLDNVRVSGAYAGLSTNGTNKGVKIIANNCTFEGKDCGVYLPADAEYEFNNCTFIGRSGICVRAGKVTLNQCTVKGQGEYDPFESFPSGAYSGNGSAILIPGSGSAYTMLELTINGGKLVSENGYGIEDLCGVPLTEAGSTYPDCHLSKLTVKDTIADCKLGKMFTVSEQQGEGHSENRKNWELSWL